MADYLKLRTTKEIIDGILIRHKGKNFFQCLKCGGIRTDAKELARTLYIIEMEASDSGNESFEELGESCSDLLREIIVIGMPEECYRDPEFCTKWNNENSERCLPELNGFECEVFIKSDEVVLKVDDVCGCVILPLTKER